jgi:hypothetical protein
VKKRERKELKMGECEKGVEVEKGGKRKGEKGKRKGGKGRKSERKKGKREKE